MEHVGDEIEAWFARHLVALECSYNVKHVDKQHERACVYYTGFVIADSSVVVWVTAGHCLEQIDRDILGDTEHYGDVRFRMVDVFHLNVKSNIPFPFDYKGREFRPYLFHKSDSGTPLGIDFGLLFLNGQDIRFLEANEIAPIDAKNWQNQPSEFDHYMLLGIPTEKITRLNQRIWMGQPAMLRLTKLAERPPEYSEHTDPMFYATIDSGSDVERIEGMSGGPIIGFKKMADGRGRYWVVAVQSGWMPSKRLICATPLHYMWNMAVDAMETGRKAREGILQVE